MSKVFNSSKGFRTSGFSMAEGDPGLVARFKVFRRSLKVDGFKNFLIQGLQASKGQRVSRHVREYL